MAAAVLTSAGGTRIAAPWLRPYVLAYAATLAGVLVIAAAVGEFAAIRRLAQALVPFDWHVAPHDPNAHDVATAFGLLLHNGRLAVAPLAATVAVQNHRGRLRTAVDVLLGVAFLANVVPLAVELGTWGSRLLPYIPNAPVELLAVVVGPVSWWLVTRGRLPLRALWLIAPVVVALMLVAACLETWAVP